MTVRYVLSDYVEKPMANAVYDKLEDGTFAGRIPHCKGVIAFAPTLRRCEAELRSTLEDWILVGLKLGRVCKKEKLESFVKIVLIIHGFRFINQLLQTRPRTLSSRVWQN